MLRTIAAPAVAWGAVFLGLAALLAATAPAGGGGGIATMLALLAPALVAVGVPATAGRLGPGVTRHDAVREAARVLAPGAVLACFALPLGAGTAVALAGFLAAFAGLAAGLRALLGGRDPDAVGAQALASVAMLALAGGIFGADPLVERYRGDAPARTWVIDFVVGANPMLVLGGDILKIDLMHAEQMYGRLSVIARFYHYTYPAWPAVAAAYLGVGAACAGSGCLARAAWARRRQRRESEVRP